MATLQKNHTFLSYLILLVGFFILVLFTKDQVVNISIHTDMRDTAYIELENARAQLEKIDATKAALQNDSAQVSQYRQVFSEDALIDYVYGFAENYTNNKDQIIVRNISFSEPKTNEFGFEEVSIDISLRVGSEAAMYAFLDFLVDPETEYRFFIDTFKYPNDGRTWGYTVNVPVKMFYK